MNARGHDSSNIDNEGESKGKQWRFTKATSDEGRQKKVERNATSDCQVRTMDKRNLSHGFLLLCNEMCKNVFYLPSKCLMDLVWLANIRKYSSSLSISSLMCLSSVGIILLLPLPDRRDPKESVSHKPFSVSLQLSCKYWFDPVTRKKFGGWRKIFNKVCSHGEI